MPFTQTTPQMEGRRESFELFTALYDAALKGDVDSLIDLLRQDEFILDRCCIEKSGHFTQSPLHVAAKLGHLEFTKKILNLKPELAEELDHVRRSTPLHLAVAKGRLEIVKALIRVNPTMCLARDQDGMNPIHVAAARSRLHVLDELLHGEPQAALAARELTSKGETVLHLCVKHRDGAALERLVNVMDDDELLNSKDSLGNTVLHLAVATRQPEMVEFLVGNKGMKKNEINTNGLTAMDICLKRKKSLRGDEEKGIEHSLKRAYALRAKVALKPQKKDRATWLENKRNALMVVASLIATMAFQIGINPPGGVWQDEKHIPINATHELVYSAGSALMASESKHQYVSLIAFDTVAMGSSLSVILLLISGLPYNRFFMIILMVAMWVAISATAVSYLISVSFLSSDIIATSDSATWKLIIWSTAIWLILLFLLLLAHATRFIKRLVLLVMRLRYRFGARATATSHQRPGNA